MSADRVEQFAADIAAAPDALERFLDGWRPPDLGGRDRFVFTGLGSSRFAALVVADAQHARGSVARVEYASTSTPTHLGDDDVLVAISSSGRTREVIDRAQGQRGRGLVVAVTNVADSALAAAADLVVPLEAGEETSGIACRTFRATVAALALLTGAAERDELRPWVDALRARIDGAATWSPALADVLDGAPAIDVLADGSLLGLAEQTALMLREGPRLPAHAAETGDWLHTGVYLALPGHRALLFPGSASDHEVLDTIRRRSGEVAKVPTTEGATATTMQRVLVDSVVAELVACELWRRATAEERNS